MNTPEAHLIQEAKKFGAVAFRTFNRVYRRDSQTITDKFSFHFFDANDEEVCYFVSDFIDSGLFKFDIPRVWSLEFKNNVNYSPWTRIPGCCGNCGSIISDAEEFNEVCFTCKKKP